MIMMMMAKADDDDDTQGIKKKNVPYSSCVMLIFPKRQRSGYEISSCV